MALFVEAVFYLEFAWRQGLPVQCVRIQLQLTRVPVVNPNLIAHFAVNASDFKAMNEINEKKNRSPIAGSAGFKGCKGGRHSVRLWSRWIQHAL
jgi:hypothetical protein